MKASHHCLISTATRLLMIFSPPAITGARRWCTRTVFRCGRGRKWASAETASCRISSSSAIIWTKIGRWRRRHQKRELHSRAEEGEGPLVETGESQQQEGAGSTTRGGGKAADSTGAGCCHLSSCKVKNTETRFSFREFVF